MKIKAFTIWVVCFLFIAACSTTVDNDSITPGATEEYIPEVQPTSTVKAFTTPTPTIVPTSAVIPTWTPVAKLSEGEAFERIRELYETNGGCELPCWWGIVPGETTLEQANEKLASLGDVSSEIYDERRWYSYSIKTPDDMGEGWVRAYLETKSNIVLGIAVIDHYAKPYSEFSLSDYLLEFGEPDQVFVKVHWNLVFFDLIYFENGVILHLTEVSNELLVEDKFNACPQDVGPFYLRTWDPEEDRTAEIIDNEILPSKNEFPILNNVFLLEEVTELTPTDFLGVAKSE